MERQGIEKTSPSAMPYGLPSVHTALEKQSPGGVGVISDLMASAMDTAVENAEDLPHFFIKAAPAKTNLSKSIYCSRTFGQPLGPATLPRWSPHNPIITFATGKGLPVWMCTIPPAGQAESSMIASRPFMQ